MNTIYLVILLFVVVCLTVLTVKRLNAVTEVIWRLLVALAGTAISLYILAHIFKAHL